MIYVNLKGGLGNQLFQFGAALRIANYNLKLINIVLDNSLHISNYKLEKLFSSPLLPQLITIKELNDKVNSTSRILIVKDQFSPFKDSPWLDNLDLNVDYFLDGYFQSSINANYLKKHFFNILNITNSQKVFDSEITIHHRLGDYSRKDVQQEIGIVDLSYIDRSIYYVNNLNNQLNRFTIFSDGNLINSIYDHFNNFDFNTDSSDITVFHKLRSSRIAIIGNSSFSLIAAYLNENLTLLIRPSIWSRKWIYDDLTTDINTKCVYIDNSFINIK